EAWTDSFASWRADTLKKRDARQEIAIDLVEGRDLVAETTSRAEGADGQFLGRVLDDFDAGAEAHRADLLLSQRLADAMARWSVRRDVTRYRRELEVV